jgi:hypothetical protein
MGAAGRAATGRATLEETSSGECPNVGNGCSRPEDRTARRRNLSASGCEDCQQRSVAAEEDYEPGAPAEEDVPARDDEDVECEQSGEQRNEHEAEEHEERRLGENSDAGAPDGKANRLRE